MSDLFQDEPPPPARPDAPPGENAPLADRLRPKRLDEVVGQDHLTGPDGAIGRMVAAGKLASMILWGPPGTGKTTIARLLADAVGMRFVAISAVFSGVADLKKAFAEAREHMRVGRQTLLFVDEIHRFNRAQQDGFLPYVEDGTVVLVGATTENPSFELNAALLSRCQVLILNRLDAAALGRLLDRAEALDGRLLPLTPAAREALVATADGDGRFVLNQAETLFAIALDQPLDPAGLAALLHRRVAVYDKDREGHYNLISALHKAIRGSDPQAALYYLARMLVAGEEPLYVLRRLTRAASEDVGLADPNALVQCLAAKEAYDFLGSPEGELAIVQACLYLRDRAQIERRLQGERRRLAIGRGDRLADAAQEHPERPDQADEADRLRRRLSIRSRSRGRFFGRRLLARGNGPADLLFPERSRLRKEDRRAHRVVGGAAKEAPRWLNRS